MISSSSHFKLKQKTSSQTIKTLTINIYRTGPVSRRADISNTGKLSNHSEKIQVTSDFLLDVSKEPLCHFTKLMVKESGTKNTEAHIVCLEERGRFVCMARSRKQKRRWNCA